MREASTAPSQGTSSAGAGAENSIKTDGERGGEESRSAQSSSSSPTTTTEENQTTRNVLSSSSSTVIDTGASEDKISSSGSSSSNNGGSGPAKPTTVQHTIATQGAAAVSTILLYPLDVVKLRFMSQDGTEARKHNNKYYTSTVSSLRDIYRGEGVGALYKGCHVAVCGSIAAWGVYMYLYRALTAILIHSDAGGLTAGEGRRKENDTSDDFLARSLVSILSSALASVATCPIFLIKTRMQVEDKSRAFAAAAAASAAGSGAHAAARPQQQLPHYTTFRASFARIVNTTGFLSLWRGLTAQLLLGVPNALHYPIYDTIKAWRLRRTSKAFLDNNEVLACSMMTKMLLMTMTHPVFVLKTRMQDHRAHLGEVKYRGLVNSFVITCKREGVRGFYRGTIPSVMQAVPRSVMHTFIYEKLLQGQIKAGGFFFSSTPPSSTGQTSKVSH